MWWNVSPFLYYKFTVKRRGQSLGGQDVVKQGRMNLKSFEVTLEKLDRRESFYSAGYTDVGRW